MNVPVEVTTRYATSVDDLPSAWAFVMNHVDLVGPDPSVKINPIWSISVSDIDREEPEGGWPRRFEVVVEGMVNADSDGDA